MFVFTIDQVDSRHTADAVAPTTAALITRYGDSIALGPDRTAGDEFQMITTDPAVALDVVLRMTRSGRWSVGLAVGPVDRPMPATTREATGVAFVLARAAVDAAKSSEHHFALRAVDSRAPIDARGVAACIDLALALRAGRSVAGWEVTDLLADGGTQVAAARRLGITPQAVSLRVRASGLRTELAALPALAALLGGLDSGVGARP